MITLLRRTNERTEVERQKTEMIMAIDLGLLESEPLSSLGKINHAHPSKSKGSIYMGFEKLSQSNKNIYFERINFVAQVYSIKHGHR